MRDLLALLRAPTCEGSTLCVRLMLCVPVHSLLYGLILICRRLILMLIVSPPVHCVARRVSTPVTSPLKPPLLWGRLRPRERRFDRSYVFQWLLCDYVLGAFLPSLPGYVRNADPLIKTGPDW